MISIQNLIAWVEALPLQNMSNALQADLLKVLNRAADLKVSFTLLLQIAEILFSEPIAKAITDIEILLNSQGGTK